MYVAHKTRGKGLQAQRLEAMQQCIVGTKLNPIKYHLYGVGTCTYHVRSTSVVPADCLFASFTLCHCCKRTYIIRVCIHTAVDGRYIHTSHHPNMNSALLPSCEHRWTGMALSLAGQSWPWLPLAVSPSYRGSSRHLPPPNTTVRSLGRAGVLVLFVYGRPSVCV